MVVEITRPYRRFIGDYKKMKIYDRLISYVGGGLMVVGIQSHDWILTGILAVTLIANLFRDQD